MLHGNALKGNTELTTIQNRKKKVSRNIDKTKT